MSTPNCPGCQDCCIDVAYPRQLQCHNLDCCYCCKEVEVKLAPNKCYAAGSALAEISGDVNGVGAQPGVYDIFDPQASNGLQHALVVLKYDIQTDANGRIAAGLWGCGYFTTKAYVCGTFALGDLNFDWRAAKASGLPIRVINGIAYLG